MEKLTLQIPGQENENICGPFGACVNNDGSFTCECLFGFEEEKQQKQQQGSTNSKNCVDKNECEALDDPCSTISDGACANLEGSFVCECDAGLRFDAESGDCVNINECLHESGLNPCGFVGECFDQTPNKTQINKYKK